MIKTPPAKQAPQPYTAPQYAPHWASFRTRLGVTAAAGPLAGLSAGGGGGDDTEMALHMYSFAVKLKGLTTCTHEMLGRL